MPQLWYALYGHESDHPDLQMMRALSEGSSEQISMAKLRTHGLLHVQDGEAV